ncbi:MAG: DUF4386 domain-containing protein [bacterium]|nr:DUF4386 domain-containing protein [bacterium]
MTTLTRTTAIDTHSDNRQFSPRRAARIAGVSYLLIYALAIFANFMVVEGLVVADNAAATVANITESIGLFRLGLIAFLVVFLLDVIVSWALWVVFRRVDRDVALVTAWFRLTYTMFLGAGLVYFFEVLQLLGSSDAAASLSAEQVNSQVMVALNSFEATWLIGLAAFGIHLVLLGRLALRSGWVPRIMAWLIIVAGVAYVVDTAAHGLLSDYESYAPLFLAIVAVPSLIGEGWLGLWLLRTRRFSP